MSPARSRSRSARRVAVPQVRRCWIWLCPSLPRTASRQAGRRKPVGRLFGHPSRTCSSHLRARDFGDHSFALRRGQLRGEAVGQPQPLQVTDLSLAQDHPRERAARGSRLTRTRAICEALSRSLTVAQNWRSRLYFQSRRGAVDARVKFISQLRMTASRLDLHCYVPLDLPFAGWSRPAAPASGGLLVGAVVILC